MLQVKFDFGSLERRRRDGFSVFINKKKVCEKEKQQKPSFVDS